MTADLTGWRLNAIGHSAAPERVTPEEWKKIMGLPPTVEEERLISPVQQAALLVLDDGTTGMLTFDPRQPRDREGKWRKTPGGGAKNVLGYTPIPVGGDLDKACQLISEGKAVELEQPDQVTALLGRIDAIVKDAQKKGEKAPSYDLCKVTVKGTNLFCHDSKGIPRIQMPQLKGKPKKGSPADKLPRDDRGEVNLGAAFQKHLEARGVKFKKKKVRADHLRATQNQLNGAKVAGITGFLEGGGQLDPESLFVSSDNYIVDGHHRWASTVAHDYADNKAGDLTMDVERADIGIGSLLFEANKFALEQGIPQAGVTALSLLGRCLLVYDPKQERWPAGTPGKGGRWRGMDIGLPSVQETLGGDRAKMFLDPYHTSPETAASPRFKPLPKPKASPQRKGESDKDYAERAKKERQAEARTKMGEAPAYLTPQIEGMIRPLKEGESVRLPEGTLVECRASGDGRHFRIDGPDGTFWRVPEHEAARVAEFEETTARANRFGETMPGNPMVPLEGVDVPAKDPVEAGVGGVLHAGYWPLPRGSEIYRKPGKHGDTFVLTSPTGTVAKFPATDKKAIIAQLREFEKQGEGRVGGPVPDQKFTPTRTAADPDGPLQPLSSRYNATRVTMHAESERVLGYEHGGNEVAIVRTPGGFGTPTYVESDRKISRFRVDGTDTVFEQDGKEVARDPIGPPPPDPEAAKQLADTFKLGDSILRDMSREGDIPYPTVAGRFDAPIIWPEHFDMAVEIGIGDEHRANYGVSPGDEAHPEPYFYVGPWAKQERGDFWNADTFNGAILPYSEVLASDDQEKTIRDFYLRHMEALGARKSPEERAAEMSPEEAQTAYKNGWATLANTKLRGLPRRGVGLTPERKRMTPEQTDARIERLVPALDREIANGKPIKGRVYRGIDLSTTPGLKAHLHKGGTFTDQGFLSTTESEIIAHNFTFNAKGGDPIVLNIHLPSGGTPAMRVSSENELERVLARGGTFTVTSDPYDTSYFGVGVKLLDVDWRPAEP